MDFPTMNMPGMPQAVGAVAQGLPAMNKAEIRRPSNSGRKSKIVAILLCLFMGCLGVHRFYVGKWKTGLIQLFTLGGLGFWSIIDLVLLIIGNFTDAANEPLT